jgi:hypothetical protein
MRPAGQRLGWLAIILAISALALLVSFKNDEPTALLDWWKPTTESSATGPSSADAAGDRQGRGRMSDSRTEALSLKLSGESELADDETARTLQHIKHKVSARADKARETQLDEEDDDFSEGELASRLGRAIDAHEKCRRHWPHLESLESAQEIRVVIFGLCACFVRLCFLLCQASFL